MRKTLTFLVIVIAMSQSVTAQNSTEGDPGYVDLSRLESVFGDNPVIEVNIHGALLKLVSEASRFEDPELADLLRRVRGVYVRGFELTGLDLDEVRRYRSSLATELESREWEAVIRARERDEDVDFFVRLRGDEIAGIVVMSIDFFSDQAVFLNIVGNIDPEQIGRIGRKFGVDTL